MSNANPIKPLLDRWLPQGAAGSAAFALLITILLGRFIPNPPISPVWVFVALFVAFFVSMLRVIRLQEVAYTTLFGARIGGDDRRMHEGLHWLIPFSTLVKVGTKPEAISVGDIVANFADASRAEVEISVSYSPSIEQLHRFVGFKDRDEVIRTETHAAVQQFARTCTTLDEALNPETNGELAAFVGAWLKARAEGKPFKTKGRQIEELGDRSTDADSSWGIRINYVSVVNLDVPAEIREVIEERERARIRVETRKYVDASMEQILAKLIDLQIPSNLALDAAQILTNPDFGRTPQPIPPTLLMTGGSRLGPVETDVEVEAPPPRRVGGKKVSEPK